MSDDEEEGNQTWTETKQNGLGNSHLKRFGQTDIRCHMRTVIFIRGERHKNRVLERRKNLNEWTERKGKDRKKDRKTQ